MTQFAVTRALMGADITAQVLALDVGCHVSLFGGNLPHIGAVSIVNPEGHVTTTQFPCHKEAVLSHKRAKTLAQLGYRPVVVEAGIHYDGLDQTEIQKVLALTDDLLVEVSATLVEPAQKCTYSEENHESRSTDL